MAAEMQLPPAPPKQYSFDIPSIFDARPALRDNPHIVNLGESTRLDFNLPRKRGEPIDPSHVLASQRACKVFKAAHAERPDRCPEDVVVTIEGYSLIATLASGLAEFRQGVDPAQPEILQAMDRLNNQMTEISNRLDQKMTTMSDGFDRKMTTMSDGFDRKMNRLDEKMKRLDEKMTRADQKIEGLTTSIDDLKKELSGRIDKLEVTVKDLEKDIKGLSDKVTDLDGRVVGLSRTVEDLERTVAGLTNRVTALEGSVTGLTNRVTDLEGSANGLTNSVNALEGSVNGLTNSVTALEVTVQDVDGRLIGLTNTVTRLDDTLILVAAQVENIVIVGYNKGHSSGIHKLLQKTVIGDGDGLVGPTMGVNTPIPADCVRNGRIGQVFPRELKIDNLRVPDIVRLIVFYNMDFGIIAASNLAAKKARIRDWVENKTD